MKKDTDVVIISAARTPIGKFGGSLKNMRAYQLAGVAMQGAIDRAGIDKAILDDVIMGDCIQCPDEANTARTAALGIGIPVETPAVTIQRQCSSAMQAVIFAGQQITAGDSEVVLAGGVESMSSAPYVLPSARWGARLMHGQMQDAMWEMLHSGSNLLNKKGYIMGQTAENLAKKYSIPREEQDVIALKSHACAEAATKAGRFKDEIVPVEVPGRKGRVTVFDTDEHTRLGLKMEDLSRLKPAFDRENGSVTAGNASGLNDGAAAVVVTSRAKAKELGVAPMAKLVANAIAGVPPEIMGYGPVPATQKVLKRAGLEMGDIELIELNEAFAAQYLACEMNLGFNRDIANVNGSGIGLGHPVGATGCRIMISLMYEMKRRNLTTGLATLCVGGGIGAAVILENE